MKIDKLLKTPKEKWNEKEKEGVCKLKEYCDALLKDLRNTDYYPEKLYDYFRLAKRGLADESTRKINKMGKIIAYNSMMEDQLGVFELYPEATSYLMDITEALPPTALCDLAVAYLEGSVVKKNKRKYFKFALAGAEHRMTGLSGGMFLVNTLIYIDVCSLMVSDAYRDGIGTKVNLPEAYRYLDRTRRDHLVVKHGSDGTEDRYEVLFQLMKKDADQGKNYPGLYSALARMYREGKGTSYDYAAYQNCLNKEMDEELKERLSNYEELNINVIYGPKGWTPVKEFKLISDSLTVGDIVEYGKYNHRSLFWKVLDIKDDQALLLCTDAIESAYIAKAKESGFPDKGIMFYGFLNYYVTAEIEDFEEKLAETEKGYVFLLSKEEVEKYLPENESRYCNCRLQAAVNGYDESGVSAPDEDTPSSIWWTSTEIDEESAYYLDPDGELNPGYKIWDPVGIRPAVWLKLK